MTRYLISFDDGAMTIPEEELPDVARAANAVVEEAPFPETKEVLGGFAVIDVATREEGLKWAAKIAVACGGAQAGRELLPDPTA